MPKRLGASLRALPIVEPNLERSLGVVRLRVRSLSVAGRRLAAMIAAHFRSV